MIARKKALITVELINQNKPIPDQFKDDFKDWLIYKGAGLGLGWHQEYYSIDENHLNDIHVKILVTITFDD